MEHGYKVNSEARGSAMPPRAYVQQMYFDTLVHDPAALRFLVDTVGVDRIVIGTDSPYNMGDDQPLKTVADADVGMTPDQLALNGARALGRPLENS